MVFCGNQCKRAGIPGVSAAVLPRNEKGRPRKHPVLSNGPTSVRDIAEDPSLPWETVVLAEGTKGPIIAERKFLRCFSCRADGSRNYVKPGDEIWLYLRKYAGDEIKYFVSNAPADLPVGELDRAATLRWPIEQCFEECKSNLGMGIMSAAATKAGTAICCL